MEQQEKPSKEEEKQNPEEEEFDEEDEEEKEGDKKNQEKVENKIETSNENKEQNNPIINSEEKKEEVKNELTQPKIEEETFTKVFASMRNHNTITFSYRSLGKTEYSEYKADVYHVLCQKGNWYILAYEYSHKDIRTFALPRMKNIIVEKSKFSVPKNFKPTDYFDPQFGVWNTNDEPVKIELLFDKNIATYISERKWHETQKLKQNENGSVILSFESNQLKETLHWIMNFASSVKVLNPDRKSVV